MLAAVPATKTEPTEYTFTYTFLSAARYEHADLQVHFVLLPVKRLKEAFSGQKSTGTWVIEATEFNFEVRSDLRGHQQPPRPFCEQ